MALVLRLYYIALHHFQYNFKAKASDETWNRN